MGLETNARRATAVCIDCSTGRERIPVGSLLSTISLPTFAKMLHPAESPSPLRFRALTFVNILLRRSDFSPNTWMYVATGRLRISRIQEPKRRSEAMAPSGHTSLMLEIPCDVGDDIWNASNTSLRELVLRELAELNFPVHDIIDSFVVRVKHGYPVYSLDYERHRQDLLSQLSRFKNVLTAGRQGLFRYIFMDAAMQMGIAAAEQMANGEHSIPTLDRMGRSSGVLESKAITA